MGEDGHMSGEEIPSLVPQVLSDLFALVLHSERGMSRVRLAANGQEWLQSSAYGRGFDRQDPPQRVGTGEMSFMTSVSVPSADDVAAAVAVAETLERSRQCEYCGVGSLQNHVIAPDIYGDPELSCLLRPNPTVVGSFGGAGQTKHVGGPSGCRYVRATEIHVPGRFYASAGHYLYGEPLTTVEAVEREWCSKCSGTAHNVREHLREKLTESLGQPATAGEVSAATREYDERRRTGDHIRYLLDEIDTRSREELLLEMRAGMHGQTAEQYLADSKKRGT